MRRIRLVPIRYVRRYECFECGREYVSPVKMSECYDCGESDNFFEMS